MSKVATVEYLKSYFDEDTRLYKSTGTWTACTTVRGKRSSKKRDSYTESPWRPDCLVFYDVTSLYFEAKLKPEDELCQTGFSKDGKTAESQIEIGLLVSEDGYPLSYSIFNGSQYEGRTMILVMGDFVQRFSLLRHRSRFRSDKRKKHRIAGDRRVQVHHWSKDTQ